MIEREFLILWTDGTRTWQSLSDLWEGENTDAYIDCISELIKEGKEEEAQRLYLMGKNHDEFNV